MVCITGQVPRRLIGYDAFQETDITGITLPITKHNYLVTDVHDLTRTIREAFYIARSGRPGPVLVDISRDAQVGTIDDWALRRAPIKLPGYRPDLRPVAQRSRAGAGDDRRRQASRDSGRPRRAALGRHARAAPVRRADPHPGGHTLLGIGALPASHPLNLGMMGMHGEAWVNHAIQEADLLLAFGMRFDDRVTGNLKSYAPRRQEDPHRDRLLRSQQERQGGPGAGRRPARDAEPTAAASRGAATTASGWSTSTRFASDSALRDIQNQPDRRPVCTRAHVVNDLWQLTHGNAIVVTDVGQNQMWAAQYYKREAPHTFISSGGLGTMGFAIPAAIGAKLAWPDSEVWAIVGDGGFQMTQAELSTAAQEGIKVNIAILNNGFLGMVRQWQEFFYDRRYAGTPLRSPDFVKIAEAHGLTGLRVTQRVRSWPRPSARRAPRRAPSSSISRSRQKTTCIRWCRPAATCTT